MQFKATLLEATIFGLLFEISKDTFSLLMLEKVCDPRMTIVEHLGKITYRIAVMLPHHYKLDRNEFDPMVKKVCMVTAKVEKYTDPSSKEESRNLRLISLL